MVLKDEHEVSGFKFVCCVTQLLRHRHVLHAIHHFYAKGAFLVHKHYKRVSALEHDGITVP
eukprot:13278703-Ditylum_brightwellii.AAC.1